MKKYLLSLFCMLVSFATFAQTVTLTFTAKDAGNHYVQLNRVAITNLTKSWQETIFWPDTVLIMQNGTGVENYIESDGFALSQNNPNPFSRNTDVSLTVAEAGAVTLEISDVNGHIVEAQNLTSLQPGIHLFHITLSTPGTYIMTARQNGQSSSIKMVCYGGGGANIIDYLGMVQTITYVLKSSTNNPFNFGDMMEYVGYAIINGTEVESQRITQAQGASQTFTLQFAETQHQVPSVITNAVSDITPFSALVGGTVTDDGGTVVFDRGICFSTVPTPTVSNICIHIGQGTGAFSDYLTGLTANTTYYVRAYAMNSIGTAYGNEVSFTTTTAAQLPTVVTAAVSDVTQNTVTCGGNVTSDGGATVTARGVCWSTSQNPTIAGNHTVDGSGTGSFTSSLTGLVSGTTYYVRAYATNSVGTAYGNEQPFTTTMTEGGDDGQPCLNTTTVSDVDGNVYNTVQVGTQCWMKENLRTTKYSDNTTIAQGSNTSTNTPYWYYPNNDASNKPTYGLLYNWKAVMRNSSSSNNNPSGVQGICPTGWHVPSNEEWLQLNTYLTNQSQYVCGNNNNYVAKSLAATTGWSSSTNTCAVGNVLSTNNSAGFDALPAGNYNGSYVNFATNTYWWTSTDHGNSFAKNCYLYSNDPYVSHHNGYRRDGFSVRCLRDENSSPTTQLPTITTSVVSNVTETTATCGGNVTSDGGATVTARGVCWSTSQNPTIAGNHTVDGSGTGSFTSSLTGLTAGTTYYVRAYATNSVGTAYGNEVSFTTTTAAQLPTVVTTSASNITQTTATCAGNIISDGGATVTVRGVCWSTSQNPTIADSHTTNGSGTGSFTSYLTGLTASTTYYMRAYAMNSVGTAYGDVVIFTTELSTIGQPCSGTPTVIDYDGNVYNTVKIGNQCWMKENLRTTHYADGDSIPLFVSNTETYYMIPYATSEYGYYYSWQAVMHNSFSSQTNPSGVQGICPTGWHVPSIAEWMELVFFVGSQDTFICDNSSNNTAKSLAATTGWTSSTNTCAVGNNQSANNATGFGALPAGYFCNYYGAENTYAYFWSSEGSGNNAEYRNLRFNGAVMQGGSQTKNHGFSVRCLRDENGSPTPQLPTITTYTVGVLTQNSAICNSYVTSDGGATVTARGVCWSTSQNPTIAGNHTTNGSGIGSFNSSLTGLVSGTTYYVRAYATNSVGTVYGNEVSFTTMGAQLPTVVTTAVSDVTQTTATCGGNVTSDGGATVTARGVCWSTSQNPTIAGNHTTDGSGIGSFTSYLTGLTAGTTYYVRAYATNSVGTAYGSVVSFTMQSIPSQFTCGSSTISDIDGNVYNTVQIGNQCWMKENMRTTHYSDGTSITQNFESDYNIAIPYYFNPGNAVTYGYLYNWSAAIGPASVSANNQGLCPDGWHVPSQDEWTELLQFVSSQSQYLCGNNYIAKALASTTEWISSENTCAVGNTPGSNNATGFSALPAGAFGGVYGHNGNGNNAYFWSATESSNGYAKYKHLVGFQAYVSGGDASETNGYSVRCLRDENNSSTLHVPTIITSAISDVAENSATCGGYITSDGGTTVTARGVCWSTTQNPTIAGDHTTDGGGMGGFTSSLTGLSEGTTYYVRAYATNSVGIVYGEEKVFSTIVHDGAPCPGNPTITDEDNNTYNTVQIGTQCWMKENLRTTKYADGTVFSQGNELSNTVAYWYYPNDNPSNKTTYGLLYNWKAVMRNSSSSTSNPSNVQGICPTGWHVPSDAEWTVLTNYVSSKVQFVCCCDSTYIAKSLAGTIGWNSDTAICVVGNLTNENNTTGFSILPAGWFYGSCGAFGNLAYFWSSTEYNQNYAWVRYLSRLNAYVTRNQNYFKNRGLSVRCLRD